MPTHTWSDDRYLEWDDRLGGKVWPVYWWFPRRWREVPGPMRVNLWNDVAGLGEWLADLGAERMARGYRR